MNKKIITVLSLSAFLFAACGSDDSSSANDNEKSSSSVAVEECDEDDCDEELDEKSSSSKKGGSKSSDSKDEKSSSSSAEGPSVVSKSEVKDSRDGKVYKTVKIGAQTWMAENLAYKTADSKCSSDDSDCKNGRLYHWADVMDLGIAANTSSAALLIKSRNKGICPEGFHVPNKSDYERLFTQPWIDNVFRNYFIRENGRYEYIDHPTDAESLVFGSDEECKMILSANSSYKESDLKSCNLYKFNGSLHKNEKSNVDYWTALESGDDKALGASLLNAKYVFGEKAFSSKSDMNYLRCVSDEELCGDKELQDNQYCYNDKVYEKAKPGDGVCDEFAADDAQLENRCYGPKDSEGLVAYSPVKFFEDGGMFYPHCGGEKIPDDKFCAANKLYEKCGGKRYDVVFETCLNSEIVDACGGSVLLETQFCFENKVYEKCGGKDFNPVEKGCVNDNIMEKCGDSVLLDTQFCHEGNIYEKCGGEDYNPVEEGCVDNVIVPKCGGKTYIPKDGIGCQDGKIVVIKYGELVDDRDGQIYKTVKIGDQNWMAENLNFADSSMTPSLKDKSWCYDNKVENCDKYGRLYTWSASIDSVALAKDVDNPRTCGFGAECAFPTVVQGICPKGWHLPDSAEWRTLLTVVGGEPTVEYGHYKWYEVGRMLKSTDGWQYGGNGTGKSGNGLDAYGFSGLPAGERTQDGGFFEVGIETYFWSATQWITEAYHRTSYIVRLYSVTMAAELLTGYMNKGYPVRCLQDSN